MASQRQYNCLVWSVTQSVLGLGGITETVQLSGYLVWSVTQSVLGLGGITETVQLSGSLL